MEATQTTSGDGIDADKTTLFGKTTAYKLSDGTLVGERMLAAVSLVNGWGAAQSKNEIAKAVGPNGSQRYGYEIVNRAIRAGLLTRPDPEHDAANPHGRGAVTVTDLGRRLLDATQ